MVFHPILIASVSRAPEGPASIAERSFTCVAFAIRAAFSFSIATEDLNRSSLDLDTAKLESSARFNSSNI